MHGWERVQNTFPRGVPVLKLSMKGLRLGMIGAFRTETKEFSWTGKRKGDEQKRE